jgi:hypothetical protein
MKKYLILFLFGICLVNVTFANSDSIPEKRKWKLDSNYVVSYPEKLIVGIFQSWRYYDLLFTQSMMLDTAGYSSMNYIARGNNSTGWSFAYDKISFSVGTSVEVTESAIFRKGISKTKNLSFSINSNRYRWEASYRKYTGFYDNYTGRRDTNFVYDSSVFYQNPTMYSKAFRLKGFYFFNKKQRFSYGAAFNNSARQLKTAGSFLFISNAYGFSIGSDTSILATGTAPFYPQWQNWNKFKSLGLSANFGYTFNLVLLKKLFANLTGTLGLELQNFKYSTSDGISKRDEWKFGWSAGDLRGSIGYNGEKIYVMLSYIGDFSVYKLDKMQIDTRLHAGMFSLGYRFKMKESKPIKWLKNNKIYRML